MDELIDEPVATVLGSGANEEFVIALRGELDLSNVEAARAVVEAGVATGPARLVFEMGELTFMDSSGIALLVDATRELDRVELRNLRAGVRRVLEITGLSGTFGLDP
ncbi:MAG: STAS domain-containing protein [Acidimicrobiales bacterium]